jgi:transposase
MLTAPSLPACLALGNGWQRRLLAEWGDDRARSSSARKVQALAGTAPVPKESGTYRHAKRRTACLKPLRNALYQFARATTRTEPWAKDYSQRKRAEAQKPFGRRARLVQYLGTDSVSHVASSQELPACDL